MIKIKRNPERKLIVLDIDETMVFVEDKYYFQDNKKLTPDFELYNGKYFGIKRPFLHQFLRDLNKKYDLAVWTSGSKDYAFAIGKIIFEPLKIRLKFMWGKEHMIDGYKDLDSVRKVFPKYDSIIAIDDQSGYYKNPDDLILIKRFVGNENDMELMKVYKTILER